jgi:hypothetical protein
MIDRSLLNLLPPLRRARGDRLYGPDQKHWVDLWKQDGAWLLGHRPEGAAKEWKNQLDKGLAAWAPSLWPRRLEPLVRQLVPGTVAVRIFRNDDRAPEAPLWRPWDDGETISSVMRLVLPTGPGQAVAVAYSEQWGGEVPDHDVTSPAEAAAVVHSAAQVLRFTGDPRAVAARLAAVEAFDRFVGPSGLFRRQGVWFWATDPHSWGPVFRRHLAAGFLLNPDPLGPGLIPTELSAGEWNAWKVVSLATEDA